MQYKYITILAVFLGTFIQIKSSVAADSLSNLPLVFDPQTKKHFIGGNSKFLLKPGEQSPVIDRIEIAVDNGEYIPYGQAIEFKQEGKHALKFRAITPVNNWSPVQYVEVFVDLTPPTTEAKFSEEKSFHDTKDLFLGLHSNISLTAQDNLSGVASIEYSWDGTNFIPYAKPISLEKAGKQTLFYRSFDRVGNQEPVKKLEFVADGTPPSSEMHLSGPNKPAVILGKTYASDSMAFTITSSDDSSRVKETWVIIDGKAQLYSKPIYFLNEGPHSLEYYSVDNVGNKEATKKFAVYTVSTPPQTVLHAEGKSINTGGIIYAAQDFKISLSAVDNVVGLDHIEIKLDDEKEFRPYFEAINFASTGMHHLSYRSVDRTGNFEPAKSYTLNIVSAVPETKFSTAQALIERDGVTYSPAPNVVTLNVNNQSGVGVQETMYSINDGPWTPYRGPLTLNDDSKNYKIAYKSVDKLGNEEQAKTASFHMVRSVPIVDLFVTNGKSAEEQVRTNFLDQPDRAVASDPGKQPKQK